MAIGPHDTRLVGRESELAHVERFLTAPGSGCRGLVIRGEAGIGKTAIWRTALDRVRGPDRLVLVTRPAEEELQAAMVGLFDLFEEVDADADVLAPDIDPFERGRAVLRTLRRLTDAQPVVLAIDDLQWLDPISRRSLRYALRRLDDHDVRVLATERTDTGGHAAAPLLAGERTEELALGMLPVDAIRQVVAPVVTRLPRPSLELIHELSGGNPMYALELARSADLNRDRLGATTRATLDDALSARLAEVPAGVRGVVETAAALGPASPDVLVSACGTPDARDDLARAIDGGLLTLDDSMLVRCTHPLLASVALGDMNPPARRALHARLADVARDSDEQARHLALATTERDAAVAAQLEDAAGRAARRGAGALAAELAAHSVRLTPLEDRSSLARRAVAEILNRAVAGETARAIGMIDAIVAALPPGPERFTAIALRVVIDAGSAEEVLARAEEEARADELVRGRVLDLLAYMMYQYRGDLARAADLETEALEIARRHRDDELEMLASATLATIDVLRGRPQPELFARALELGGYVQDPRLGRWPDVERGRQSLWAGRLDEAREVFTRLQEMTARSGSEFQRPFRAFDLGLVELASGQLTAAAQLLDDGLESASDAGNTSAAMWLRYPDGLTHVHLGGADARARQAVEEMREWGRARGEQTRLVMAAHVAGVHALAAGDGPSALAELSAGAAQARRLGLAHPGIIAVLPDAIEAAALTGDAGAATELAAELDAQAADLDLPWVTAAARRGRGLAALTSGGGRDAPAALAEASEMFDALGYRLDGARARLWHGRALQRAGRRAAAADAFADARDRLLAMEARPWAEQAAADLERVAPGRATGELTDDERRIVALVVDGRRNREIAASLYVSVATVEAHLTRIYRKLGVRSRSELTRRLLESAPAGSHVPSPR